MATRTNTPFTYIVILILVFVISSGYIAHNVLYEKTIQRSVVALVTYTRPTSAYRISLLGQSFVVKPKRVGSKDPMSITAGIAVPVQPPISSIAPSNNMEAILYSAADEFGVERALAKAMMTQESGSDPNAISPAGATGLMQVMPATAEGIARDLGMTDYSLADPSTNARFGAYYIAAKLQRYQSVEWALAAYNWGPGSVDGFLERHPEAASLDWQTVITMWGNEIPGETQGYVTTITAMAERNRIAAQEVTQPVVATLQGVSAPITIDGSDFGINVRAALTANGGKLQQIVIQPGEEWSFNESIGDPTVLDLRYVSGVLGGGWCDLASRYVQALRPILPPSSIRFPLHGVALNHVSYEDSVVIWSDGSRGGQDLLVTNTLDRTILMTVSTLNETEVVVTATTR